MSHLHSTTRPRSCILLIWSELSCGKYYADMIRNSLKSVNINNSASKDEIIIENVLYIELLVGYKPWYLKIGLILVF